MQGVYKITNILDGKFYVGSSKNIESRWYTHRKELNLGCHNNQHLQRAWNKYGEENFTFEVLEEVANLEDVRDRENYYIKSTKCYDHSIGYNMLDDATIGIGVSHSLEVKQKISEACKGKKNGHYGHKHSEETKQRIREKKQLQGKLLREKNLQKWIDEQHCCEICGKLMTIKYGSGRFCSKECANRSISIKNKAINHTDEWSAKIRNSSKGKVFSSEHRRKISEYAKERFSVPENNPMYGKHHSEATKDLISKKLKSTTINSSRFSGHKHSEETKQKIRETLAKTREEKKSGKTDKIL